MKLIHYTDKKFFFDDRKYDESKNILKSKPRGLWVSVEGKYDWKWWCEAEKFHLENLKFSYEVVLKKDAKILHLKTSKEIKEFTKKYVLNEGNWDIDNGSYQIQWNLVKKKYQGIIISPYQWDCRLALETCWYYGWDCASGCIWDLSCIKEFKLIKKIE